MKFVHTADWHIGKSRFIPNYLDRQIQGIKFAYDVAAKNNCDFVLCAGDLVERVVLRPEEKDALLDLLAYYDKQNIKTYIIAGNHDRVSQDYTNLHFIKILTKSHFKNITIAVNEPLSIDMGKVFLGLVPFAPYTQDELEAVVHGMLDKAKKPGVIAFHALMNGSTTDIGHLLSSKLVVPAIPEVIYWALGDIHKYQSMADNAVYCGSPIQHDFGEYLPKGVLVVDIEDTVKTEFVNVEGVKPLVTVESLTDIPEDAWVRVRGNVQLMEQDLPRNVLKTQVVNVAKKVDIAKVEDPLAGLDDVLKNMGVPDVAETVKLAKGLLKET